MDKHATCSSIVAQSHITHMFSELVKWTNMPRAHLLWLRVRWLTCSVDQQNGQNDNATCSSIDAFTVIISLKKLYPHPPLEKPPPHLSPKPLSPLKY